MAMPTSEEVMRALKGVHDPEIGLSIVDLGLVYGARIDGSTVNVDMTLTSPACPLGSMIKSQVCNILESNFDDVEEVKVHLVWEPPWDPRTMASEDVKLELGIW
jgi:metal-sulfur cluster biosynthetic enzyme